MAISPANKLFLGLYGGLWRAARPALRRHKRLREGFEQRLVPDSWPDAPAAQSSMPRFADKDALRIWLQAASGGEAWLLHSLVPALVSVLTEKLFTRSEYSGRALHLLCTTCTRQGLDVLEKLEKLEKPEKPHTGGPDSPPASDPPLRGMSGPPVRIFPRYLPLDGPCQMEKAIRQARPHLIALLETELWPGLLAAARQADLPVLVLNARMTEKSASNYRLLRSFFRSVRPAGIAAVSESDARRFAGLFGCPEHVSVMPNIKFDRLREAAPTADPAALRLETGIGEGALLAVLASVREEEEDSLLPVLRALRERTFEGCGLAFAVAPRHMHRVKAWQDKLSEAGLKWRLRSQCRETAGERGREAQPGPLPLILWDSFGDLLSLYAMADAVFVGGSLAPLGGQNFLEPASLGLIPVVGPHIANFHWVGEDFFAGGLGLRVEKKEDLAAALLRQLEARHALLRNAASLEQRQGLRQAEAEKGRESFRRWLAPRLGGSAKAAELIARALQAVPK